MNLRPFRFIATLFALIAALAAQSVSAVDLPLNLYGKVNISYDTKDPGKNDWQSNASRIGIKGSYQLHPEYSVIYQIEQEVDYAHGGTSIDSLLVMRNTFVGLEGSFGTVFFGTNDTPIKASQMKIDLFNDQVGDIKNLLEGEVRATDSWFYESPKSTSGLAVKAAYVPADDNFGSSQSFVVSYEPGDLYFSVGYDANMRKNDKSVSSTKVYDSVRAVSQYKWNGWQFGALLQSSKRQQFVSAEDEFGYSLSVAKKLKDLTLKLQHGSSDILAKDVTSTLVGADYNIAKNTKIYGYYWRFDKSEKTDVFSIGAEYKF